MKCDPQLCARTQFATLIADMIPLTDRAATSLDIPAGTLNSIVKQSGLMVEIMEYVAIIEKSENCFGAFVPDLPGCVAVGETREETVQLIKEAVELHIESLRKSGQSAPAPAATTEKIAV